MLLGECVPVSTLCNCFSLLAAVTGTSLVTMSRELAWTVRSELAVAALWLHSHTLSVGGSFLRYLEHALRTYSNKR